MSLLLNFPGFRTQPTYAARGVRPDANAWKVPETDEEWRERYDWLWGAYMGDQYSIGDIKALQLFRALDDTTAEESIGITTRVVRDVQHVVDVGVGCTGGGRLTLADVEPGPVDSPLLADARALWRASRMRQRMSGILRITLGMGQSFIEPLRRGGDGAVRLVDYDPRNCRVQYDATGLVMTQATIVTNFIADDGETINTTRRELYPDKIEVFVNNKPDPSQSGPHGLGVVPLVHLKAIDIGQPEYAVWVGLGMEQPLAYVDSVLSQIRTIGTRHGNPTMTITGAVIDEGANISFGRVLNVPNGAEIKYLQMQAGSIRELSDVAIKTLQEVRTTLPEFIMNAGGANESGTSRSWRATQLENKYADVRENIFPELARVAAMAVAMSKGRPYNEAEDVLNVEAPPILPIDIAREVEMLKVVSVDMGAITAVDRTRHLQRLGIVPEEVNAEEYAKELEDLQMERAQQFFNEGGEESDMEDENTDTSGEGDE